MAECRNLGKEMAMMLTEDLISEILVRLPVISLLRCRCVCKAWYHLIDSPNFINMHLKHSTSKTNRILLSRSFENWSNVLSFHDYESFDLINFYGMDPDLDYFSLVISGPCNGLLCVKDYDSNIVLYNPSLGEYKPLPPHLFPHGKGWMYRVKGFGLGFDSKSNDYKVISLVSFYHVNSESSESDIDSEDIVGDLDINEDNEVGEDNVDIGDGEENYNAEDDDNHEDNEVGEDIEYGEESDDSEDEPMDKVEIYDLSTNSWREIKCDFPYSIDGNQYGTLFEGALHWTSFGDRGAIVLCFDMTTEVFRYMELPSDHLRKNGTYLSLTVVKDSLGLFVYTKYYYDSEQQFIDIWVMKEYGVAESWSKQFRVGPLSGINRPLMIWKNEAIFLESFEGQLLSCDLDTNEIKEFEYKGMKGLSRVMVFQV